jgi:hypothetical protein
MDARRNGCTIASLAGKGGAWPAMLARRLTRYSPTSSVQYFRPEGDVAEARP